MSSLGSVVRAAPVRTAVGTFGGSLKDVASTQLGAAAVQRARLSPDEIGTVVMGNVVQAGANPEEAHMNDGNSGRGLARPVCLLPKGGTIQAAGTNRRQRAQRLSTSLGKVPKGRLS
jgi:hypothetical protein